MRSIVRATAVAVALLAVSGGHSARPGPVPIPVRVVIHGPDGGKPEGVASATAFARRTGFSAFEPTLGVLSDGTVFYQAAHSLQNAGVTFFGGGPDVLRTKDAGRSWEETSPTVGDQRLHPFTSDPYVHVDSVTDRIFTVDWVPGYCSELSFSDDRGESWTTAPLACGGADHQHLFTGPPSLSVPVAYPNVVYVCAQSIPSAICSKSLDGGRSFMHTGALPFAAVSDILDCGRLTGHGVVGPDGTVYLPSACDKPYLAISGDEGATWRIETIADKPANGNHETAVGVDRAGNLYYFWIGADRMPYLSLSDNNGRSWKRPVRIATPTLKEASLPALAVSPSGTVAAAYMGSSNAPTNRRDYSKTTWGGYVSVTRNALSSKPTFATAVFGSRSDPLVIGECGPRRCQAQYDFIDVQIDDAGGVWASFVDGCDRRTCMDFDDGEIRFGEGVLAAVRPRL